MITYTKRGGRTVELFLPFEVDGQKVEAIAFGPIRLEHMLKWRKGDYKGSILTLMADVAQCKEEVFRAIAYPDADTVMRIFIDMLPPEIRNSFVESASLDGVVEQPEPVAESIGQPANGQTRFTPEEENILHAKRFEMDLPERDPTGLGVDLNG